MRELGTFAFTTTNDLDLLEMLISGLHLTALLKGYEGFFVNVWLYYIIEGRQTGAKRPKSVGRTI